MIEFTATFLLTVTFAAVAFFGAYVAYRLVVLCHTWINKERHAWVLDKTKKNSNVIPEDFWYSVRVWEIGA